ncbi:TatD family hydrolase [Alistipes sp. OttesenSCG-928-B03]|nr:TatD family hydrolase [Alistipes sp. OttesenSCG-928-B03]
MPRFVDIHTHNMQPQPDTVAVYSHRIGHGALPPEGMPFSAGVHPWDAAAVDLESALAYLETAPAVAVGEIGLDFATDIDRTRQAEVFAAQLRIAERRCLPVVIHCVRAYNEALRILNDFSLQGVVFHAYTGSEQQTQALLDAGYFISVGRRSLHSPKTVAALRALLPLDRLFAETDDDPDTVAYIYKGMAAALGVAERELEVQIMDNFKRIFGWTE